MNIILDAPPQERWLISSRLPAIRLPKPARPRLDVIDWLRGLVMVIMAAGLAPLRAQNEPGEWRFLGLQGRIVQQLRLHDHHLYAATDSGLYRKDLGTADTLWTPIGLQGKQARALLIFDADSLLASTQYDTVSLYRTTDAGATWSSYQNGFGGESSETVYAGLESYILMTTDGGDTWEEIFVEEGRFFFGIAINPARPERIYAASWFKTPDPETIISFSLPATGLATLKIYDASGREVATLANRVMAAGEHRILWRPDGLASGVYFYRLQAGKFAAARKLLILQ